MKSMMKMVGIIAVLALIGLVSGCEQEVDPEDQTLITVTEIPLGFEGMYASVTISDKLVTDPSYKIIATSYIRKIVGGAVTCDMKDEKGKAAIVEQGYVIIGIAKTQTDKEYVYAGSSTSPVALGKSAQTKKTAELLLVPDINDASKEFENLEAAPSEANFGTYIALKNNSTAGVTETIVFTKTTFDIFESTGDTFTFNIEKWENATTPDTPSGTAATYPKAYKFTGKITSAKKGGTDSDSNVTSTPISSTDTSTGALGYFLSSNTAPEIKPSDMNNTEVWMYLYCKEDNKGNITEFVRSSFNKEGQVGASGTAGQGFDSTTKEYKKPIPKGDTVNATSGLRVYNKI